MIVSLYPVINFQCLNNEENSQAYIFMHYDNDICKAVLHIKQLNTASKPITIDFIKFFNLLGYLYIGYKTFLFSLSMVDIR